MKDFPIHCNLHAGANQCSDYILSIVGSLTPGTTIYATAGKAAMAALTRAMPNAAGEFYGALKCAICIV